MCPWKPQLTSTSTWEEREQRARGGASTTGQSFHDFLALDLQLRGAGVWHLLALHDRCLFRATQAPSTRPRPAWPRQKVKSQKKGNTLNSVRK